MGLAASQARLLNLTSRMHDIEYKAQKLEAQKLQMANESTQVYLEYENALNLTKLQLKQINNDGSAAYVDATYDLLTKSGYYMSMIGTGLDSNANKMVVEQTDVDTFNRVGSAEKFAAIKSGMCEVKTVGGVSNCVTLADTNTICIFTASDLTDAVARSSATKILMNDITINAPVGDLSGTLDGNGHTITVKGTNGLFNNINSATLKNLNIDLDINSSADYIGGIAQNVYGETTVENVNLTGSIVSNSTTTATIGGLFSSVKPDANVEIKNVNSYVDIIQTKDSTRATNFPYIGGLVAFSSNAKLSITDSIYNGSISSIGGGRSGGLVGLYEVSVNNPSKKLTIQNNMTSGSISSTGNLDETQGAFYAGGLIGQIGNNTTTAISDLFNVSNNESSMNISIEGKKTNSGAAGVVGYLWNANSSAVMTGTLSNNYTNNAQLTNNDTGTVNRGTPSIYCTEDTYGYSNILSNESSTTSFCTATGAKTSTSVNHKENASYNYYLRIGESIASDNYVVAGDYMNDAIWLSEMLNSAYILLSKVDSDSNVYEVNVATDTSLQEVSDETLLKKAEAKYEADMRKINQKDKKFDTELAAMDAERNAVKTEMDTLKSVAKENVDRTFKLFG